MAEVGTGGGVLGDVGEVGKVVRVLARAVDVADLVGADDLENKTKQIY